MPGRPKTLADHRLECAAILAWMDIWDDIRDTLGIADIAMVRVRLLTSSLVGLPALIEVTMSIGRRHVTELIGVRWLSTQCTRERLCEWTIKIVQRLESSRHRLMGLVADDVADALIRLPEARDGDTR